MRNHIRRWNEWRKYNHNSWFHKFLVLLRRVESPSMNAYVTIVEGHADDEDAWDQSWLRRIRK